MSWFLNGKLLDCDQELYRNFPLVISERWQQEVTETVYDAVNADTDKAEARRRAKNKQLGHEEGRRALGTGVFQKRKKTKRAAVASVTSVSPCWGRLVCYSRAPKENRAPALGPGEPRHREQHLSRPLGWASLAWPGLAGSSWKRDTPVWAGPACPCALPSHRGLDGASCPASAPQDPGSEMALEEGPCPLR